MILPPALRTLAARVCSSIVDAGEVSRLGVFLCDVDGASDEPGAVVTTRAGLVEAATQLAKAGGVIPTPEFIAQITETPAWKVPIVILCENKLRVAQYMPKRGAA